VEAEIAAGPPDRVDLCLISLTNLRSALLTCIKLTLPIYRLMAMGLPLALGDGACTRARAAQQNAAPGDMLVVDEIEAPEADLGCRLHP
jgi:hypothetical protein